jgi:hypothetical protein
VNFDAKFIYTLYPNPAEDVIEVGIDNVTGFTGQIQIFNTQSQVLMSKKINSGNQPLKLDITALVRGTYFMKITASDGTTTIQKFIKQ